MPTTEIEITYAHEAQVVPVGRRRPEGRWYAHTMVISVREATVEEAPLVLGPEDPECFRNVDEHRWHDGRLWTRERHHSIRDDDLPHDARWLARRLSGGKGLGRLDDDRTIRQVADDGRATTEGRLRQACRDTLVIDGETWVPADEPVLRVDPLGGREVMLHVGPVPRPDSYCYRADQLDWAVADHGEPHVRPNLRVHRPDLLKARTTESALLEVASVVLDQMGDSLRHQGRPYFDAFAALREVADRARVALATSDGEVDVRSLDETVRAALDVAAAPSRDARTDRRSLDRFQRPVLARVERHLAEHDQVVGMVL